MAAPHPKSKNSASFLATSARIGGDSEPLLLGKNEDGSDEDGKGKGGFQTSSDAARKSPGEPCRNSRMALDNDEGGSDEGGGGFLASSDNKFPPGVSGDPAATD